MKKVLAQAMELVKPSIEDKKKAQKCVDDFVKFNVKDAKVVVGGSAAKNTWLKDAHDADFFVMFDYNKYKDKSDKISDLLEKPLRKVYPKAVRLHGSRDYFQVDIKGFTYEIIPILNITKADKARNITDISPLHAKWVSKHKKVVDEIRLTKAFCKANNLYGAESYIKGFSGYVCEILTINYGSFLKLIKAAAKWKDKDVIDFERYHKGKNVLMELNTSKLLSPLIVIDPVQAGRNAAAALSEDNFELFIKKSKQFLKRPSIKFFKKHEIDLKKKAGKNELITLNIENVKGKEDVVGCKLLKIISLIKNELARHEFNLIDEGLLYNEDKSTIYFIIKKEVKPLTIVHKGPPVSSKEFVKHFKKKHKHTFIKTGIIYAKDKRAFKTAKDLIKKMIKDPYVKERTKSVKLK